MSIKDRLLKIKNHIHSIDIDGETYHYKLMTASALAIAQSYPNEQVNSAMFVLCTCEEDGSAIFSLEEIGEVESLPVSITGALVNAIINGNEKKQPDA